MNRSRFRFRHPLRVRYAEVDAQGVVFNAHYLTYFDVAITEYFRALGYDYMAAVADTGIDFHTVKALVEYKAPIRYDDEIEVHARVARLGRTSLAFEFAIFRQGEGALLSTGEVVWVAADQRTHRPVPVPEPLAARIRAHEGDRLDEPKK